MAKEMVQFVEVAIDTLNAEQREAWDCLMEAKAAFKLTLQSLAPAGKRIVFSDKYNKLKIGAANMAQAKSAALTLAQWQEQQAIM